MRSPFVVENDGMSHTGQVSDIFPPGMYPADIPDIEDMEGVMERCDSREGVTDGDTGSDRMRCIAST